MLRLRFTLAALAILLAPTAHATTVVMATDEALLAQAEAVVRVEILGSKPGRTPSGLPATEYAARVEAVLKGDTPSAITLRVLGGATTDGHVWEVYGVPHFGAGDRALLFLMRHPDGTWGPLHLAMGAFHEIRTVSSRLAVRDLTEMEDATGERLELDPARDVARFERWIADRVAGRPADANYRVALPAATLGKLRPTYTYIGGHRTRWSAFDAGAAVHWRANESGQDGTPGHGIDELRSAINAWNGDPNTNIKYQYDGTTSNRNGFLPEEGDGQNVVLWNDPNGEVEGTFSCVRPGNGSGVLALGGPYSTLSGNPRQIVEADVVTNDGIGCWLNNDPSKLTQVLGHELGHTLGLGHSCGDDRTGDCDTTAKNEALMRANAHNDQRGARLGDDDRAAIFDLYPGADGGGGGGGGNKPAAPTALTASEVTSTSVRLTWVDNASNETTVRVENKTGSASFGEILSVNANATTIVVASLTPNTTYSFRVRARNNDGPSSYSNVVVVTTPGGLPTAPAKLVAAPLSTTQIRLTWEDRSSNETGFGIEVESPTSPGFQSVGAVAAANQPGFVVSGLVPGTPYTFRVRALGTGGNSAFAAEASATTYEAVGPCVAAADTLCLTGGRFRVKAQWRKQNGTHGEATAVPYANGDQSGLFWFFDASNIELLVKVLDGRASNNHFWVFYGALSDVQYWITVEDTVLPHSATYHSPQGSFCGAADTGALAGTSAPAGRWIELGASDGGKFTSESAAATIAPSCTPNATTLCLLGGRFQVSVAFTSKNASGDGQALTLPGDASGMFWFFSDANVELAVKAIDGTGLNGKYWLFYGALTDVEYDLTVTDTLRQVTRTYHNTKGSLCGRGDTGAFNP